MEYIWGHIRVHILSAMNLLNLKVSKPSTRKELLFDWSIYLTVLNTIG